MNELRYDGKVAVITGVGRGLGAAYATRALLWERLDEFVTHVTGTTAASR